MAQKVVAKHENGMGIAVDLIYTDQKRKTTENCKEAKRCTKRMSNQQYSVCSTEKKTKDVSVLV